MAKTANKIRTISTQLLLLFLFSLACAQTVKAQDAQPLLDYRVDELLDEFTRFPLRANKMFKRKGFRCTGKVSKIENDEKEGGLYVTFSETSKREVILAVDKANLDQWQNLKIRQDCVFSAYVVFGGQASDGRFIIQLRLYYPGLPLARPVEPLRNEVQIERALRIVQTGQRISVEEVSSIFGKPFDEEETINPKNHTYVWKLGKHRLFVQLEEGIIIGIRHVRPQYQ